MKKHTYMLFLPVCILNLLIAAPGWSEEEEEDAYDAQRCINTRAIKRTDIVDDRNILFFAYGDTVYHNVLPRPCRGLSRERRFSYRLSERRLCYNDRIRVLYSTGGSLEEGRSCQLGYFRPTTKEDIAVFIENLQGLPKAKEPKLPDPEEVGVESEESTDSSDAPSN